jgi:hypothetical protein
MPDITSVLERAAAAPTRTPDVEGPRRRQRTTRALAAVGACAAVVVIAVFAVMLQPARTKPRVTTTHPAEQPPASAPLRSHDATIDVASGWQASSEPLAWWLDSPFELFSIATSPLPPSPHRQPNEAACPSEIPQVAVDNIADDGAYLWVGEWRPGVGLYTPSARPPTFDGLTWQPGCELPRGEKSYVGIFRDGTHDYSVTYVLGKDAPPSRQADIDRMLDSLRFDG